MRPVSNWIPPVGNPDGEGRDGAGGATPPPPPPAPDARVQPRYGELAPEGWVPPQPNAPGWTPPPPPGLIPLRPLGLGDVLAASFKVMRRNPKPTYGFAVVYGVITAVILGGLSAFATQELLARVTFASTAAMQDIASGTVVGAVVLFIVTVLAGYALGAVPQGIIALEVARGTIGDKSTLRSLWDGAKGRIWALVGWFLLIAVVGTVYAGIIITVGLTPLLTGSGGVQDVLGAIGLVVLLGLLGVVPAVWIGTKLAYVPAVLIVERATLGRAIARSWVLTDQRFWRTFGTLLLLTLMLNVAISIVTMPIQLIASLFLGIVAPTGTEESLLWGALVVGTVVEVVSTVFVAVATVALAAAPTLLYIDARIRKEGLDVVLQHAAEERAAGRDPGDPYATR